MSPVGLPSPHVDERRLAHAADVGVEAELTTAEQRHVSLCGPCGSLLEGHRRAAQLLGSPWKRVDVPVQSVPLRSRVRAERWVELAGAVVIGVALTAGWLNWRGGGTPEVASSASPPGLTTTVPSGSSSPIATGTPAEISSPSAPGGVLNIPAALRTNVPLPAGAEIDSRRLVADSDWLVMGLTFADKPLYEPLYAANLHTGAIRKIADSAPPDFSVAGSRAAWAAWTCQSSWPSPMPTEQAHPQQQVQCSSWSVMLTDLDTGASRVVAQGRNPDIAVEQQTPVPVVPAVTLAQDTLAYTTGDLSHGIQLNLLTLSSGATRTLPLGGPVQEMRWAGGDLALIECTDLHAAGTSPGGYAYPYYLDSLLVLLPPGASAVQQIADGAYWLAADTGEIAWVTGGTDIWTASAPNWRPIQAGYEAVSGPFVSGGWLGWGGTWRQTPFLVLLPWNTVPLSVPGGLALTGGWLVLGSNPDQQGLPTKLEVVWQDSGLE